MLSRRSTMFVASALFVLRFSLSHASFGISKEWKCSGVRKKIAIYYTTGSGEKCAVIKVSVHQLSRKARDLRRLSRGCITNYERRSANDRAQTNCQRRKSELPFNNGDGPSLARYLTAVFLFWINTFFFVWLRHRCPL